MTNDLAQVRQDVAAAINALPGITADYTVPDRVTPPLVAVQPGAPYLAPGVNLPANIWQMTLTLTLLVNNGTNETAMNNIDDGITQVIQALNATQWTITVGEPFAMQVGAAVYPAVDITITNYLEIN